MTRTTKTTWLALLAVAVPLTGGGATEPPRELPDGLESQAMPLEFRAGMGRGSDWGQGERLSVTTAAKPASGPYVVPQHLVSSPSNVASQGEYREGEDREREGREWEDRESGDTEAAVDGELAEQEQEPEQEASESEESQRFEPLDQGDEAVADPHVAPSSAALHMDRLAERERFDGEENGNGESIAASASPFPLGVLGSFGGLRYALMGCSLLCALMLARKWFRESSAEHDAGEASDGEDLGEVSSDRSPAVGAAEELAFPRDSHQAEHLEVKRDGGTSPRKKTAKRATGPSTEERPSERRGGPRSRWRFLVPRASLSLPGCAARPGAAPTSVTAPTPIAAPAQASSPSGTDSTSPKPSTANSAGSAVPSTVPAPTVILLSQAAPAAALPTMVPGLSSGFPGPPYGVGFAGSAPGLGPSLWDPSARAWGGGGVWPPAITPSAYAHGMPAPQPYSVSMPYPTPAPPTVQIPVQVPIQVPVPVQIPVPVHVPIAMPIHYAACAPHAAPTSGGGDTRRDGNASSSS